MSAIPRARNRFFLLALAVLAATVPARGGETDPGVADDTLATLRAYSLELVNTARRQAGLRQLVPGTALTEAAQFHAEDMLQRRYHAHASPDGDTVVDRYAAAGGPPYRVIAENIARWDGYTAPPDREAVEFLHKGWMNSPEHRRNILRRGLTHYGFGLAWDGAGARLAVQTFAGTRAAADSAAPATGSRQAAEDGG